MLGALFGAISEVTKGSGSRNDSDIIDRLNHRWTVVLLVIFSVLVSTTQYVGNPIHCWCPAYFTENHEGFANRVCWVSNTYYLSDPYAVPGAGGVRKSYIGYYQWVPLVLLVQALCFYLPCLFWRVLGDRSGINISNLVEAADTIQNALYPERREKTVKYMIRHLDHFLEFQREYRGGWCDKFKRCLAKYVCLRCGNRYGNYLITLYMFIKVLNFANVLLQLYLLDVVLGNNFHLFGIQLILDLFSNVRNRLENSAVLQSNVIPMSSRFFPKVTLCDFEVRQMGNVHRHTVQCVLSINLFNEKIFVVLWYWFFLVALANFLSFGVWVWQVGFEYQRSLYVRRQLTVTRRLSGSADEDGRASSAVLRQFVVVYLRQDGLFVLRLVAKNSTQLVAADILAALWDSYRNSTSTNRRRNTAPVADEEPLEDTTDAAD